MNKAALASIVGGANGGEVHQIVADDGSQKRKPDFRTAMEDVKALATVLVIEAEGILRRRLSLRSPTVLFAIGVVVTLVLAVVVILLLFLVLNWYVAPTKPGERKDLVLAVAQILGGTALLSGLYFTWRTLQVNREGQITDRFTRAIDQLGSDELEIRLGGIYALERIARDSEQEHWPIMEVLTAYVRQHTRRRLPNEGISGMLKRSRSRKPALLLPVPISKR